MALRRLLETLQKLEEQQQFLESPHGLLLVTVQRPGRSAFLGAANTSYKGVMKIL